MQRRDTWNSRGQQAIKVEPLKANNKQANALSFSGMQLLKRNMVKKAKDSMARKFSEIIEQQSDYRFGFHIK